MWRWRREVNGRPSTVVLAQVFRPPICLPSVFCGHIPGSEVPIPGSEVPTHPLPVLGSCSAQQGHVVWGWCSSVFSALPFVPSFPMRVSACKAEARSGLHGCSWRLCMALVSPRAYPSVPPLLEETESLRHSLMSFIGYGFKFSK